MLGRRHRLVAEPMTRLRSIAICLAAALLMAGASPRWQAKQSADGRENAYRENNRGVALLEQYNYADAAAAFRRALTVAPDLPIARVNLAIALLYEGNAEAGASATQAAAALPNSPHAHYVVGLAARARGDNDEAITAFRRVLAIDASDAGTRINLGQILSQQRGYQEAATLFREALAAEPFNATAAYGLATALTRSGSGDEGRAAMQRFETLRDAPYAVTYAQTYLSQGKYGEAIASTGAEPDVVDPNPPRVSFVDATDSGLPPSARTANAQPPAEAPDDAGSVSLVDLDSDGDLDAYSVAAAGPRLYLNAGTGSPPFSDVTSARGLDQSRGARAAVLGDYDNDRRADILLLASAGPRLLHQRADGRSRMSAGRRGCRAPRIAPSRVRSPTSTTTATSTSSSPAPGPPTSCCETTATGRSRRSPRASGVADGAAQAIAVVPTDFDDRRDIDLLVLGATGAPRLFKNMRDGTFRDAGAAAGLPRDGAFSAIASGDRQQGRLPGLLLRAEGLRRGAHAERRPRAIHDRRDRLIRRRARRPRSFSTTTTTASWISSSPQGGRCGFSGTLARSGPKSRTRTGLATLAAGSWCGRSIRRVRRPRSRRRPRRAGTACQRPAAILAQRGRSEHDRCACDPTGRVSNRFGIGAKIDMRAGSLRQRVETYRRDAGSRSGGRNLRPGRPSAADVVRVIWPSGTLQAETAGDGRALTVNELDRKPSSCPYLYTWNGSRFDVPDRLHGRRRDRLLDGSRASGTRRIPTSTSAFRRVGSSRATAATSCASRTSSRKRCSSIIFSWSPSIIPAARTSFRTKGSVRRTRDAFRHATCAAAARSPRRRRAWPRRLDRLDRPRSRVSGRLSRCSTFAVTPSVARSPSGPRADAAATSSCWRPAGPTTRFLRRQRRRITIEG